MLGGVWITAYVFWLVLSFDPAKIGATVDESAFRPDSDVVDYVSDREGTVFLWSPMAYKTIETAYMMRFVPDIETLTANVPMGGWTEGSPYDEEIARAAGIGEPLRGLTDPVVRLAVESNEELEALLTYVREHYAPNASARVEATVYDDLTGKTVIFAQITE